MRFMWVLIFSLLFVPLLYAQSNWTESLTISTYYPAPYGVYRTLKLNPALESQLSGVSEGVVYYDKDLHVLRYRDNNDQWVNISGGFWTQNGNNISSSNAGNVLIAGGVLVLPSLVSVPSSANVEGSIRFTGTDFAGYYGGKWNSLLVTASTPAPTTPAPVKPVNGVCGGAATSYYFLATGLSGALCSAGSSFPASPSFPEPGQSTIWTCAGTGGGSNIDCTASRALHVYQNECNSLSGSWACAGYGIGGHYCGCSVGYNYYYYTY